MNGIESAVNLLTPTVLFCILNLMIATIFILHSHKKQLPLPGSDQFPRVPSLFGRVRSINISMYRTDPQPDPVNHFTPSEKPVIRHHETQQPEEPVEEHHEDGDEEHDEIIHVRRTKSDTKAMKKKKPALKILKKSVSEKIMIEEVIEVDDRRPATVREKKSTFDGEDEEVDAKADDFINKFRQQLKLQRLDSILRYKEMLNRGAAR